MFHDKREEYLLKLLNINESAKQIDKEDLICCGNCEFSSECLPVNEASDLCTKWEFDGLKRMNRLIKE